MKASARAALRWLMDMGADETISDVPIDRFATAAVPVAAAPAPRARDAAPTPRPSPARPLPSAPSTTLPQGDAAASAREIAATCDTLPALRAALQSFEGCSLKKTATQLVFADGAPDAPLMLIGEAPGRDEDIKGLPFVGASGQLLDRVLAAIGRDRTKVYITNMLFWRPPGNREPTIEETATCLPFVERHIALKRPKVIVTLGNIAAKQILRTSEGITRLRGKWFLYERDGLSIPIIATFHPAALLRNPANKRYVWRDFLSVQEKLESLGVER